MTWMYGEQGRFKKQMRQWAFLNDFFGDMIVDEAFFEPEVEGPESIGNPLARLDYGVPPRMDTGTETAFVTTHESYWSQKRASNPAETRTSREPSLAAQAE